MSDEQKTPVTEVRAKGIGNVVISVSLPPELAEYVKHQENTSEYIRQLISADRAKATPPKERKNADKTALEQALEEHDALEKEYFTWAEVHEEELYEGGFEHDRGGSPAYSKKVGSKTLIETDQKYRQRLKALDSKVREARAQVDAKTGNEVDKQKTEKYWRGIMGDAEFERRQKAAKDVGITWP